MYKRSLFTFSLFRCIQGHLFYLEISTLVV
jgi:hypothetical protein